MKFKAFSLIELLVVVAIIAVLASIAIPAYTTYKIRSNLITFINQIKQETILPIEQYIDTQQAVPSGGVGIKSSPFLAFASGNWTGGTYATFEMHLVSATTGLDTSRTWTFGMGIKYLNGTFYYGCGAVNGANSYYAPFTYLPPNCQCGDVENWALTSSAKNC